jgi:hypothetical protein
MLDTSHTSTEPAILKPLDLSEVISTSTAAKMARVSKATIRNWSAWHKIGRRVGGRWLVSFPAFLMHLDGDQEALSLYLSGDRQSPRVRRFFEKAASLSCEDA